MAWLMRRAQTYQPDSAKKRPGKRRNGQTLRFVSTEHQIYVGKLRTLLGGCGEDAMRSAIQGATSIAIKKIVPEADERLPQ